MKVGLYDIKKAYIGLNEINSSNGYVGLQPLIDAAPQPVGEDYFYVELDKTIDSSQNWRIYLDSRVLDASTLEFSTNGTTWSNNYTVEGGSGTTITDTIENIITTYGRDYVIPIIARGFDFDLTSATSEEGCTCSLYDEAGEYYLCFITNNAISTYTNGFSFTFNDGTTHTIDGFALSDYADMSSYTCIACDDSSDTPDYRPQILETTVTVSTGASALVYIETTRNNKIYLRSDSNDGNRILKNQYNYYNIGGDIQTLFDYTTQATTAPLLKGAFKEYDHLRNAGDLKLSYTTLIQECYQEMFMNCSGLITGPTTLPATTLVNYCYKSMFNGCSGLITGPTTLPATTLAALCCYQMFYNCSSLASAPALPATTLAESCYAYMFFGCSGLTSAPATLPATTLEINCYYYMFAGCSSLTSAPALPATTLAYSCCYQMFYNCSSLTSAPALPATTLAQGCYGSMFRGCSSLTSAPALSATTLALNCYNRMFYDCSNLSSITCLATNVSASGCTTDWVSGVAASGTFTKNSTMSSWTTGTNGIPSGWTVQDA